jgi:hypothetical protein
MCQTAAARHLRLNFEGKAWGDSVIRETRRRSPQRSLREKRPLATDGPEDGDRKETDKRSAADVGQPRSMVSGGSGGMQGALHEPRVRLASRERFAARPRDSEVGQGRLK